MVRAGGFRFANGSSWSCRPDSCWLRGGRIGSVTGQSLLQEAFRGNPSGDTETGWYRGSVLMIHPGHAKGACQGLLTFTRNPSSRTGRRPAKVFAGAASNGSFLLPRERKFRNVESCPQSFDIDNGERQEYRFLWGLLRNCIP